MPKVKLKQIDPSGASSGQVATYDGTTWAPAAAAGGLDNEAISAYNSSGFDVMSATGTLVTLTLDATHYTPNASFFALASNEIEVVVAGKYAVQWHVGIRNDSGTSRSQAESFLERDPLGAGSFAEVAGTKSWHYCRLQNYGASAGGDIVLDLTAGDLLRLRGVRRLGFNTLETAPDFVRLKVTRLT